MASKMQLTTYLLGICLFSICFLVFVNASISFVITDLIRQKRGVGNAVGTLGFADELLALVACPLWGLLSDQLGFRYVSVVGYTVIAISLFALVQSVNVYPQLLCGRLLFSLGASCVSTMVTAILPTMVTRLPSRAPSEFAADREGQDKAQKSHSRLAGFVGLFTGTGALLAVGLYLPLPSRLQQLGVKSDRALADTYYLAGATAVTVAVACYCGLSPKNPGSAPKDSSFGKAPSVANQFFKSLFYIPKALRLGLTESSLSLAFLASFVARSSSVGISLFIPLFVNATRCDHPAKDLGDVKIHCRRAYVVAAQLTGASQMFALLFAPIFGFLPFRYKNFHLPLMIAAASGVVGNIAFAELNTSEIRPALFAVVALLGISQIGAIVSSLSLVSSFINDGSSTRGPSAVTWANTAASQEETSPLIDTALASKDYQRLKGTIAGIYSFSGSLAVLILTKLGGLLFDRLGPTSPFSLLAFFNTLLLFAVLVCGVMENIGAQSN